MRRPLANAICAMCASCFCATPKCCAFPRTGLECAYFLFEKTYRQPAGAWRVQDFGTGTISILLTACQGAAIQFPQQIFSLYGLALGMFCPPCSISYRDSYFPKHPLPRLSVKIASANISPIIAAFGWNAIFLRNYCSGLRNSACAVVSLYCATKLA